VLVIPRRLCLLNHDYDVFRFCFVCVLFFLTHLIPAIVSPLPRPGLDPILDSFALLSPAMSHLVASDVRSVISLDFVPRRDPPSYSFEFEGKSAPVISRPGTPLSTVLLYR
jgi:hypothetical protein